MMPANICGTVSGSYVCRNVLYTIEYIVNASNGFGRYIVYQLLHYKSVALV